MIVGISGISGKMGGELCAILRAQGVNYIGLSRSSKSENITQNIDEFCLKSDIIIDFSSPDLTMEILDLNAKKEKKPILICTSGFSKEQIFQMQNLASDFNICLCYNTSYGVNLTKKVASILAKSMPSSDIEILETHHRNKIDSPSGTAIELAKVICDARNFEYEKAVNTNRKKRREPGEIGISSLRGGSVFGEHTISFMLDDEVIEITHKAMNRSIFARGAVDLALNLQKFQGKAGKLLTYNDLINYDS